MRSAEEIEKDACVLAQRMFEMCSTERFPEKGPIVDVLLAAIRAAQAEALEWAEERVVEVAHIRDQCSLTLERIAGDISAKAKEIREQGGEK